VQFFERNNQETVNIGLEIGLEWRIFAKNG
jgi:hypothetical protein